jgi:hypothetical protein
LADKKPNTVAASASGGSPIRKFSSRKNPSKNELAEFRNYVAQLKRTGKITSKVSARNARPANISGGKTFAEIVNVNREALKPFVPKFRLPKQTPFLLTDLPGLKATTFSGVLEEIAADPKKYDALIDPNDRIAAVIEGTGTTIFYRTLSELAEEWEYGHSFQDLTAPEARGLLKTIKVVRWPADKSKADWLAIRPVNKAAYAKIKRENAKRRALNRRTRRR